MPFVLLASVPSIFGRNLDSDFVGVFFSVCLLCLLLAYAYYIEIKASFEKAYWNLERHLNSENSKELAAATLRSIALNYINRKAP